MCPGFNRVIGVVMTASLTSHQSPQESFGQDHLALQRAGLRPLVPARPPLHLAEPEGQLQIHTASFRGSFSDVLSQSVRSAGLGRRVVIAQFLKGGVRQGPEGEVQLCGGLSWLRPDVPACVSESGELNTADAVNAIWQICSRHLRSGEVDQLVLDEVGLAVDLGYIAEADVLSSLQQRSTALDVIITGPSIPPSVMAMADQVTQLRRGF